MPNRLWLLFLANASVLITHQINAVYWHEWELLLIPGGNQVNGLLNIPIIGWSMYTHSLVVTNMKTDMPLYKLLAWLGLLTDRLRRSRLDLLQPFEGCTADDHIGWV